MPTMGQPESATVALPSGREIVITRVFAAPRTRVFEAWTTPQLVSRWLEPAGWTMPVCEIDLNVGGSYRFYLDDWDLSSHTVSLDGAFMPGDDWLVSLGYRFYRQSSASHYEPYYLVMPEPDYYTSDKELTALSSHHVGVDFDRESTRGRITRRTHEGIRTRLKVGCRTRDVGYGGTAGAGTCGFSESRSRRQCPGGKR